MRAHHLLRFACSYRSRSGAKKTIHGEGETSNIVCEVAGVLASFKSGVMKEFRFHFLFVSFNLDLLTCAYLNFIIIVVLDLSPLYLKGQRFSKSLVVFYRTLDLLLRCCHTVRFGYRYVPACCPLLLYESKRRRGYIWLSALVRRCSRFSKKPFQRPPSMFKWLLSCFSPRDRCRLMGFVSCCFASSYLAYFLRQKPARFESSKPAVDVCLCANASPCLCSPTVSPLIRSGPARHRRCLNNDGRLFISYFLAHTEQGGGVR